MKKFALFLTFCLVLSLSACGRATAEELEKSRPAMTVISSGQQVKSCFSGGDWTYQGVTEQSCGPHPMQNVDMLSENAAVPASSGDEISMDFSVMPDSVTVCYWPADEAVAEGEDIPDGQSVNISFANDLFSFTVPDSSQNIVFVVDAQWTGYRNMSGSLTYSFITA